MKTICLMVLVLAMVAKSEESADELRAKLQVNAQLKDAAASLINRHIKAEQARGQGGRVKVLRDKIMALTVRMETEAKKHQQPLMIEGDIAPLRDELKQVVDELAEELKQKPERYEHELNMAINYFKESKKNMGKAAILKEYAAVVGAAEKIVANPKIDAAEIRKMVKK